MLQSSLQCGKEARELKLFKAQANALPVKRTRFIQSPVDEALSAMVHYSLIELFKS